MQLSELKTTVKTISYWSEETPRPASLPTATLPAEVDVAVVGGGYTGLNAARVIAQDNASVVVLEKQTIGWGASSRNGGIAIPGNRQSMQVIIHRYGEKLASEFWQASIEAIDLIGEIVADENISCHFLRKGHMTLAAKPSHFATLRKKADWYRYRLNYDLQVVGPAEMRQEIGSKVFHGGLIDEWSAGLHPTKYLYGLAEAVARHGGLLCEKTAVLRIEKKRDRFWVHTDKGVIKANEVVVATNGYTGDLIPGIRSRIVPAGSYTIVTDRIPLSILQKISPNERVFIDSLRHPHYFRIVPNGRLLFGGAHNLTSSIDLMTSAERLYAQMLHIFPDLRGIPVTHSWSGQIGQTFDQMPHIGRIDGVHYAMGYGGQGVAMATYLGTEVGKLLCGHIKRSPFMDIPHPTRFYYRGRPWFLPIRAWFDRLMDQLT